MTEFAVNATKSASEALESFIELSEKYHIISFVNWFFSSLVVGLQSDRDPPLCRTSTRLKIAGGESA